MFSTFPKPKAILILRNAARGIATTKSASAKEKGSKVALIGASGQIGQPLSLLLKTSPLISKLSLYDVLHSPGVAADLRHINTDCSVNGFGPGELGAAIKDADFIIVAAGVPRKAGFSMKDQFVATSRIIKDLSVSCARENPNAIYGFISHPIISSVPLFSEMFTKAGVYNPKKILGITKLGEIRASCFVAEELTLSPSSVSCPVIGGHSGVTILPVLSQCKPSVSLEPERRKKLTKRLRDAGTEVFEAKFGAGAVTLSMAYAGAKFTDSVLKGIQGEKDVVESCYVRSDVTSAKYFTNRVILGPNGVEKNLGIGKLNEFEKEELELGLPELKRSIEAGEAFAAQKI